MYLPPIKGQTEDKLRIISEPLHERIGNDEAHTGRPEEDTVPVELKENHQPHPQLGSKIDEGVKHADLTGSDGSVTCSLHLSVNVPVPHVVDGAARPPHDQGARPEHGQQGEVGHIASLGYQAQQPSTWPEQ